MILTDAQFEDLSWLDCHIWSLELWAGDPEEGAWTSDLALGVDFIVEWICGLDGGARFRVAPAEPVFHGSVVAQAPFQRRPGDEGSFSSETPPDRDALMTPRADAVLTLTCLAVSSLFATDLVAQDTHTYVGPQVPSTAGAPPFSGAVKAGNTLYLSGTLGLNAGRQRPATVEEEATNVLNSIKSTLESGGMTMDDLVFVQIFCSDVSDYDAFNAVYRTYFTREFPARAFVGSGTLLFGARFEVMGVAVKR